MTLASSEGRAQRLISQGNGDRHSILVADDPRDVTFASRIFDQLDATRYQGDLPASRQLNLAPTTERDDELAPGTGMPIIEIPRRLPAKLHARGLEHVGVVTVGDLQLD